MKILLVSTNYYPELTGIGKYSGEMGNWLQSKGHEVHVICSQPYYPEWKIHDGYRKKFYKVDFESGVKVFRCPIWVPENPTGLTRIIHLLTFAISSFPILLRHIFWRPDLVFCVEPPIVNTIGSIIVSKLSGAKSILHIQDFEIDAAFDLGILKSNFIKKIIYKSERIIMSAFDRVSTISEAMIDKLSEKNVKQDNRILYPNWVDINFIKPLDQSSYRKALDIKDQQIVALYSGNIGEKQGLELIIKSAESLRNILFIIAGEGAAKKRLQELAIGVENVMWLPIQPYENLNDFLNVADIHLLTQLPDAADLVMPSKLTGMLSSGIPVVANANEGTQVYKVVSKCGIAVPSFDTESFAKAIADLADDENKRIKFGNFAREYAEKYLQFSEIMADFNKTIKELVKK